MIEGPPLFISGGGPLYENLLKRRKNILKKKKSACLFSPNMVFSIIRIIPILEGETDGWKTVHTCD